MRKLYLDRNLQIMFGLWLILVLGVSSVSPVLPKLMEDLHVSTSSIGLVISAFTAPGIILAPMVGILADRLGRKRILVAALLIFGVFGGCCGFAPDFETLLIFRLLQGVGVAPIGVLNPTIVSDLYSGRERVAAMGYSTMVLSVGTALFPLAGGVLGTFGWRYPFLLSLSALPLALLVQLFLHNPEPEKTEGFSAYMKATASALFTGKALAILSLTFLTSVILFGPFVTYLPVVLGRRFDVSSATIGLVVSVASVFTFLASSQVGRLSVRTGMRGAILRAAFILYLSAMLIVPLGWELWVFLLPVALFGAGMGLNTPIRVSLLGELAPMRNRASVMSVNNMVLRTGQTVSPVLMGVVAAGLGLDAVYFVGACLALAMLLLVKAAAFETQGNDGRHS